MLHYFVLLFLISSGICTCPNGYKHLGNGDCFKIQLALGESNSHREVELICEKEGGTLAYPLNAFVNAEVVNEAIEGDIWLGITCLGNTTTSCTYSNGDKVTSSSYTNFNPGEPNPDNGHCVYMLSFDGYGGWASSSCQNEQWDIGCQITAESMLPNYVLKCGNSYQEFDNFCYKKLSSTTQKEAESACELECGHLTSIHSQQENDFIQSFSLSTGESRVFIGLEYTSNQDYEWTDGSISPLDYSNFGRNDSNLGSCVAMSLMNDEVSKGKWTNVPCTSNHSSVCKRARNRPCVSFVQPSISPFTPPVSTPPASTTKYSTALPTLAPPTCTSVFNLTGNGTIFSPGYPFRYLNDLECEYVITAPPGSVVFFALTSPGQFPDDAGSISLYNSITDTVPFIPRLSIEYNWYYTFYASTTSSMKVKFCSGSLDQYRWTANYTSVDIRPSGCNQGVLQTPGTITSPNYGGNFYDGRYPSQYNCSYQLEAPSNKRISLIFNYFYTESFIDYLSVYDGPDSKSHLLEKYSGGGIPPSITSSNNKMFLLFTSDDYASYPGFKATFTAI